MPSFTTDRNSDCGVLGEDVEVKIGYYVDAGGEVEIEFLKFNLKTYDGRYCHGRWISIDKELVSDDEMEQYLMAAQDDAKRRYDAEEGAKEDAAESRNDWLKEKALWEKG